MTTNLLLVAILVVLFALLTAIKSGFNQVIAGLQAIDAQRRSAGIREPGA